MGKASATSTIVTAIAMLSPEVKEDVFDGEMLKLNKERYKSSDYATDWIKRAETFAANGQNDRALKDAEAALARE